MSPEVTGPEREIVIACLAGEQPGAYNVPVFVRFDEPVDAARLAKVTFAVLAAAPTLRRTYAREGRTVRRVPAAAPLVERLSIAAPEDRYAVASARRIAVTDPVLARAAVLETGADAPTYLYLNVHHALVDGMSLSLLLQAILQGYLTGAIEVLPEAAAAPPAAATPEAADLSPWQARPDLAGTVLGALAARRDPAAGVSVTERAIECAKLPGFAECLGAAVPALADWLGLEQVIVSTALAGRTIGNLKSLGNFVRLQPLALDAREPGDLSDLARRLTIASSSPPGPAGPAHPLLRAVTGSVIFDYKRESLISRRLHPGLAAELVADDSYVDVKYDLHLSLYQCGTTQQVTLTARELPEAAVTELLDAYHARLTGEPGRSVPSVPSAIAS